MKKIAKRAVQTLPVLQPPLSLQMQVVSKLDSVLEQVEQLNGVSAQKLTALMELKKSLLQRAFSGELTTLRQVEIETALA